jgi:hypothetical protein
MTKMENDNFLKMYRIDFPSFSSLAVLHAEPVSLIRDVGYTFSKDAFQIIGDLVAPSRRTADQFNQFLASHSQTHEQILFFLDGPYHIANHIWAVRNSIEEIAMVSCEESGEVNIEAPPAAGLLMIANVPILADLAQRSPFLGQLLPIADGPPDDAIWVYFLGKAEQIEISICEEEETPKENGIKELTIVGLPGEHE